MNAYQCLYCGESTGVQGYKWDIRFCPYCGIEYKGFVLAEEAGHIALEEKNFYYWQIQKGEKHYGQTTEEAEVSGISDDNTKLIWSNYLDSHSWCHLSAYQILKQLKNLRREEEIRCAESREIFSWDASWIEPSQFRAIRCKEKRTSYIKTKPGNVFKKTGKFLEEDRNNRPLFREPHIDKTTFQELQWEKERQENDLAKA